MSNDQKSLIDTVRAQLRLSLRQSSTSNSDTSDGSQQGSIQKQHGADTASGGSVQKIGPKGAANIARGDVTSAPGDARFHHAGPVKRSLQHPHGPSVAWPHLYRILRRKGHSEEGAARISNMMYNKIKSGRYKRHKPRPPFPGVGGVSPGGNAAALAAGLASDLARYGRVHKLDSDEHDTAMLALYPSALTASRLSVPNGEPDEDMHVTLVYFGKTSALSEGQQALIHSAVEQVSREWQDGPLAGHVGGATIFTMPDGTKCFTAHVDSPKLAKFREQLVDALEQRGVPFRQDHGFTPHMTIKYLSEGGRTPPMPGRVPMIFHDVAVVLNDDRTYYELPDFRTGSEHLMLRRLMQHPASGKFTSVRKDALSSGYKDVLHPREAGGKYIETPDAIKTAKKPKQTQSKSTQTKAKMSSVRAVRRRAMRDGLLEHQGFHLPDTHGHKNITSQHWAHGDTAYKVSLEAHRIAEATTGVPMGDRTPYDDDSMSPMARYSAATLMRHLAERDAPETEVPMYRSAVAGEATIGKLTEDAAKGHEIDAPLAGFSPKPDRTHDSHSVTFVLEPGAKHLPVEGAGGTEVMSGGRFRIQSVKKQPDGQHHVTLQHVGAIDPDSGEVVSKRFTKPYHRCDYSHMIDGPVDPHEGKPPEPKVKEPLTQ